jgi:hypothetical protein
VLRQLSNIGLALSLLAGGWCGALAAAALCPHAGCRTQATAPASADSHEHGSPAPAGHHAAVADASDHHAHGQASPSEAGTSPVESSSLLSSHSQSCAHCMGRPEAPASARERRALQAKDDGRGDAPPEAGVVEPPAPSFHRKVTPHQGAPPGGPAARRHLLISVFRI